MRSISNFKDSENSEEAKDEFINIQYLNNQELQQQRNQ